MFNVDDQGLDGSRVSTAWPNSGEQAQEAPEITKLHLFRLERDTERVGSCVPLGSSREHLKRNKPRGLSAKYHGAMHLLSVRGAM